MGAVIWDILVIAFYVKSPAIYRPGPVMAWCQADVCTSCPLFASLWKSI